MTNENEMSAEELAKQKESARNAQLYIHQDPAISLIYANALANSGAYGTEAVDYSEEGALEALASQSPGMEMLVSNTWGRTVKEAKEKKIDLESISLTASMIIKNSEPFLYGGIDMLKTNDLLAIMGINDKGLKKISDEDREMYMGDLKESNPEIYTKLKKDYKNFKRLSAIQMVYSFPLSRIKAEWSENHL